MMVEGEDQISGYAATLGVAAALLWLAATAAAEEREPSAIVEIGGAGMLCDVSRMAL